MIILGQLHNSPYAGASLAETTSGNKYLIFRTGYAAVVLVYRVEDDGSLKILLIKETRELLEVEFDQSIQVIKIIGGYMKNAFPNDTSFIDYLIKKESGYELSKEGENNIVVQGDFPDFEIAVFPIKEVCINAKYLLKVCEPPGGSELFWVTLEEAVELAVTGAFRDAATEVAVMRFFILLKLGKLNL